MYIKKEKPDILTKYSKTRVRDLSVWIMSCNVTMFECFNSLNKDTEKNQKNKLKTQKQETILLHRMFLCKNKFCRLA